METLKARALGKLQLHHAGRAAVSFPTRHVEELLAFLLVNQQHRHTRESLISLLWPDCGLQTGRRRFNTVLWRLRKIFKDLGISAERFLTTNRSWVAFIPRTKLRFDVKRFEWKLQQAQRADDIQRRERRLREALALCQGAFCEGVYADWCLIERERIARLRLRALGQLMTCRMEHGDYAGASEFGRLILQEDPLREEVHRSLMFCYLQLDRPTQALRQFHRCSTLLLQELQIAPMRETVELFNQIAAGRMQHAQTLIEAAPAAETELQAALLDFQQASQRLNHLLHDQDG
jgi:DNA-binding SARP family transcriptional activator